MPQLAGWENFYVIVGSSAGALIGLQFVVMTLIAQIPIMRDLEGGSSAFATPNVVHLGAVLLLSAGAGTLGIYRLDGALTRYDDLFGNTIGPPPSDAWSMQHAALYTVLWAVAFLAVFVPLSVRQYRRAASR